MSRLTRLNYRHVIPDICLIVLSFYLSLYLRLGWHETRIYLPTMNNYILIFLIIKLGTLTTIGVYDVIWRYVSASDATKVVKAIFLATLLVITSTYFIDIGKLPRSIFIIDAFLATIFLAGIRLLRRIVFEHGAEKTIQELGRRTLIYGAGTNGRTMAQRLTTDSSLGLHLIGFIDDNIQKVGRSIGGVKVLGTFKEFDSLIKHHHIQELIVAISNPSGDLLRAVIHKSHEHQLQPRLITKTNREDGPQKTTGLFREVQLSDLLNRAPNQVDLGALKQFIQGRRILITGAGGSIGSELARQVFTNNPSRLILLDHSEYNLYKINQELSIPHQSADLTVPVLADLKDKIGLKHIMQEHLPEIIFHAAAYKHVHLCQSNPYAAIVNNILGTKNLLELSNHIGVDTFVQISTDKAVNPAGVMGATKRACELLVIDSAEKTEKRYCSVRFGNVLGSSGSLIPLLQKQIKQSEPITITHKDMRRYFMLTSEAVSLVLTAARLSAPGDIMILRMGEPIKIIDIAKNLITLMGKKEDQVHIVFTGVRSGEKMFEELYLSGNELKTEHPDVLVLSKGGYSPEDVNNQSFMQTIEKIISHARNNSKVAIRELNGLIQAKNSRGDRRQQEPSQSHHQTGLERASL